MRYDIILLDLDNTVIDFDYAEKNALQLTFKEFNLPFRKEHLDNFHEINDNLWKLLEKGEIIRANLVRIRFEKLFDMFDIKGISPLEFNAKYLENLGKGRRVIDGATQTIIDLTNMGAKCYFITNGAIAIQNSRLKGQPFMDYISGICISESVGYKKPDKEFFIKAEELFNVKFSEKTLVVGDSLSSDIKGGINANIDTCWINRKREENLSNIKPTYEIYKIEELLNIVK